MVVKFIRFIFYWHRIQFFSIMVYSAEIFHELFNCTRINGRILHGEIKTKFQYQWSDIGQAIGMSWKWLLIFADLAAFNISTIKRNLFLWSNSDGSAIARMLLEIMEIYWCRSQWSVICAVEKCFSWFNCKLSIHVIIIWSEMMRLEGNLTQANDDIDACCQFYERMRRGQNV